jgi:hypothetical protein
MNILVAFVWIREEKRDITFLFIDKNVASTDLILRISFEQVEIASKLATYLKSALKSESTYMCSNLLCRHFCFLKKFTPGPLTYKTKIIPSKNVSKIEMSI